MKLNNFLSEERFDPTTITVGDTVEFKSTTLFGKEGRTINGRVSKIIKHDKYSIVGNPMSVTFRELSLKPMEYQIALGDRDYEDSETWEVHDVHNMIKTLKKVPRDGQEAHDIKYQAEQDEMKEYEDIHDKIRDLIHKYGEKYEKKHGNWLRLRYSDDSWLVMDSWNEAIWLVQGDIAYDNKFTGFEGGKKIAYLGMNFGGRERPTEIPIERMRMYLKNAEDSVKFATKYKQPVNEAVKPDRPITSRKDFRQWQRDSAVAKEAELTAHPEKKRKTTTPHYSASQLIKYEECPLNYKFDYIDKIKKAFKQSPSAAFGSMMHKLAEKVTIGNLKSLGETLGLVKEKYFYVGDDYMSQATAIGRNIFDYLWTFRNAGKMYREIRYKMKLADGSDMVGNFDILIVTPTNKIIILDWKLYKKMQGLSAEHIYTQFSNYALLTWKGTCKEGVPQVTPENTTVILFFPFQKEKKVVRFTTKGIEDYETNVNTIIQSINMLRQDDATYRQSLEKVKAIRKFDQGKKEAKDGKSYFKLGKPCTFCQFRGECGKTLDQEAAKIAFTPPTESK